MRIACFVLLACSGAAHAIDAARIEPVTLDTLEVTSSKLSTTLRDSAASVAIVSGEDLRARGARDLRSALALVAGVDIAPGGDGGPAASVPALWGLREFDAFLLVVDGVPSGGAFTPALATLDLTDVERIEVLKGAAPVSFGATSFVGVIQVIHYPAGTGPAYAQVGFGSRGSARVALATSLTRTAAGGSSLLFSGERQRLASDRTGFDRAHVLYRFVDEVAGGKFNVDADVTALRQDPASPHPRESATLTPRFPRDANVNPRDARSDEDREQLALGFVRDTRLGEWSTRLALAHSRAEITRGFLRADFADDGITHNADGYRQQRTLNDLYFDSHFTTRLSEQAILAWGVDHLYGNGRQRSGNFEYAVLPDGSNAPDSHSLPVDERTELDDRRNFSGLYGELHYTVTPKWRIEAGLRLNFTNETRHGTLVDIADGGGASDLGMQQRRQTRGSGVFGTSVKLWQRDRDAVVAFASYRDSFKPAVIDFGPEAEADILAPETAHSLEAGLKSEYGGGRFGWELALFEMRFRNLVVSQDVDGLPGLANAGAERFRGAEAEARYVFSDALQLRANWSYHNARFGDYVQLFGNTPTQLRGNLLELSPQHLYSAGLLYAPTHGFSASLTMAYVGARWLNKRNTALAPGYTLADAGIGYRFEQVELRLDGYNLGNRRDPAAESELGDAQYYRLPARSFELSLRYDFGPQ